MVPEESEIVTDKSQEQLKEFMESTMGLDVPPSVLISKAVKISADIVTVDDTSLDREIADINQSLKEHTTSGEFNEEDLLKSYADLSDEIKEIRSYLVGSGTLPQMKSKTMYLKLSQDVPAPISDVQPERDTIPKLDQSGMKIYLEEWAKRTNTKMASSTIKGLTSILVENPGIKVENISYIRLGWESRGDHNLIEINNTLTSMKEFIQASMSDQKEFRSYFKAITDGMGRQINKILTSLVELSQKTPQQFVNVPKTQEAVPPSKSVTGKQSVLPIFGGAEDPPKLGQGPLEKGSTSHPMIGDKTLDPISRKKVSALLAKLNKGIKEIQVLNPRRSALYVLLHMVSDSSLTEITGLNDKDSAIWYSAIQLYMTEASLLNVPPPAGTK